jgi:GR25 family glycosyltransferase involved in LPS biosynthesis
MEFFDKIYVISLVHRKDRRTHIQTEMDRFGTTFAFYDAVYGKEEKNNKAWYALSKQIINPKAIGNLHPGEIGCLLSHYMVWTDILLHMKEDKWYLIVEDDCAFHKDVTNEYLQKAFENLPPDAKILKFAHLNLYGRSVERYSDYWYKIKGNSFSTMCYAVHSSAIKPLLGHMYDSPIDHLVLGNAYVMNWNNFVLDPTFIMNYYEIGEKKIPNYYHGICYSSDNINSDVQGDFVDVVDVKQQCRPIGAQI